MESNETDDQEILQKLVDWFVKIKISLELLAEDAKHLLDWREQYHFVFDFDQQTGQLRSVQRQPPWDKDDNALAEDFRGFCEDSGEFVIKEVEALSDYRIALDGALSNLPDRVHKLLSDVRGGNWPSHVRCKCLVPLNYWPRLPSRQEWRPNISRNRRPEIPGRLDRLLEYMEEVDPTTHWQELCRQIDSYIDDVVTIAPEVHASVVTIAPEVDASVVIIPDGPLFVANEFQRQILEALDGRAMPKQALADAICGGEGSRLYRPGGINELRDAKKVLNKTRLGYYRPDAPPPENVVN